jgi:hypothetical protein
LIDPAGFQISASGNNIYPAAAFNGTNYLVVWTQQTGASSWQVVARRVSPDGKVLDSADIVIGDGTYYGPARVASDGTNWLVVSARAMAQTGCGNTGSAVRLYATRISASGVVLDGSGVVLSTNDGEDQKEADLVWTGAKYLIASTSYCAGFHQPYYSSVTATIASPDLSEIRSARVSFQGYVWIGLENSYSNPHVAGGPAGSLIAWEHHTSTETKAEYTVVDDALPVMPARHRVVASTLSFPALPGSLVAAGTEPNGQNYVLTQMTVPWATGYQGIWQTTIDADGISQPPVYRFYLEKGQALTGDVVLSGGKHWMASTLFDVAAGAVRLHVPQF